MAEVLDISNPKGSSTSPDGTTLVEKLAGEDFDRDVMKVEDRSGYTPFSADILAKSGAGVLKGLFIGAASATPTIKIWDNTAGSGTVLIETFIPTVGQYIPFPDVEFATGLFIDITGTVAGTVFWK